MPTRNTTGKCRCCLPQTYPIRLELTKVVVDTVVESSTGLQPEGESLVWYRIVYSDGTVNQVNGARVYRSGADGTYVRTEDGVCIGISEMTIGGYVTPPPKERDMYAFTDRIDGETTILPVYIIIGKEIIAETIGDGENAIVECSFAPVE